MLYSIGNNLWQAQLGDKWGIVNNINQIIVDIKWDWVYPPKDGKFKARQGDAYFYFDEEDNATI